MDALRITKGPEVKLRLWLDFAGAHVLLNLLNESGKRNKVHFIFFSQRV